MPDNTLVINDTIYTLTDAYREGAQAMRDDITWHANPYTYGSESYDDWDYGHTHEAAGFHMVEDVDVITQPSLGTEFIQTKEEDV